MQLQLIHASKQNIVEKIRIQKLQDNGKIHIPPSKPYSHETLKLNNLIAVEEQTLHLRGMMK